MKKVRANKMPAGRRKKRDDIKNVLGLTQEEMGMLLGVNMSQWSMYKSNKRDISTDSKLKLTALLQSVQNEKGESEEISKFLADEEEHTKKKRKEDEVKFELKLRRVQKEIAILENNRAEALAVLRTVDQLGKQEVPDDGLILIIRDRALKTLQKYNSYSLEQLQLKQQSLELMKKGIQQKIQSFEDEAKFPVIGG